MLLSEFLLPLDDCIKRIDEQIDTFDLIPSFKAALVKTYLYGPVDKWDDMQQEWPNTTRMLQELAQDLMFKYEDYELIEMALEELVSRYEDEAAAVQSVLDNGLQM